MANYNQAFQNTIQGGRYGYNFGPADSADTVPAILVVDSATRNRDLYENPGQYTHNLIKCYTEVVSIQLVKASIPRSGYDITASNNTVTFTYASTEYSITLTSGIYSSLQLAAELQLRMNEELGFSDTAVATARFTVEADATLSALVITSPTSASTQIVFIAGATNNADNVIGLGTSNVTSVTVGTPPTATKVVTMPNAYNLTPDRYMILHIRGLERCDCNNNATQGAFGIIPLDIETDNYSLNCCNINNDSYTYHFIEPLPKLKTLEISFLKRDGSVYDFNGQDHFMVFEVTCLSRRASAPARR
jgi:hypothetical protein